MTSPVGGMVAAVGSALSGLPFVIVNAGPFIQLSSAPHSVNVPLTSVMQQSSGTVGVQPTFLTVSRGSAMSLALAQRHVSGAAGVPSATKPVPRLSRLNAIDLSVTSAADPDMTVVSSVVSFTPVQPPLAVASGPKSINITFYAVDSPESGDFEHVIARREIAPIPGAICSVEETARVGSSYLCSVCQKTFSSAPQLAVHRNIHYFEQQFRCGICRSSFASHATLEHHRIKKHHGKPVSVASTDPRPYKCDECGVAFRIQGHLDKHKRSKVHAARLENSHELVNNEDTDRPTGALALSADDGGGTEAATVCEESGSHPEIELKQTDDGE